MEIIYCFCTQNWLTVTSGKNKVHPLFNSQVREIINNHLVLINYNTVCVEEQLTTYCTVICLTKTKVKTEYTPWFSSLLGQMASHWAQEYFAYKGARGCLNYCKVPTSSLLQVWGVCADMLWFGFDKRGAVDFAQTFSMSNEHCSRSHVVCSDVILLI